MSLATIARSYGLTETTAPAVEPVTRAEAKLWLRETQGDQDDVIDELITYARRTIEGYTSRQLITATWKMYLDEFVQVIRVPVAPLQSVTSIVYADADGVSQTLDAAEYQVDTDFDPGRIVEAYSKSWPGTRVQLQAVTITFKAGFGDAASDVPVEYRHLMKRIIVDRYDVERGEVITGSTATLLPNRVREELRGLRVPIL